MKSKLDNEQETKREEEYSFLFTPLRSQNSNNCTTTLSSTMQQQHSSCTSPLHSSLLSSPTGTQSPSIPIPTSNNKHLDEDDSFFEEHLKIPFNQQQRFNKSPIRGGKSHRGRGNKLLNQVTKGHQRSTSFDVSSFQQLSDHHHYPQQHHQPAFTTTSNLNQTQPCISTNNYSNNYSKEKNFPKPSSSKFNINEEEEEDFEKPITLSPIKSSPTITPPNISLNNFKTPLKTNSPIDENNPIHSPFSSSSTTSSNCSSPTYSKKKPNLKIDIVKNKPIIPLQPLLNNSSTTPQSSLSSSEILLKEDNNESKNSDIKKPLTDQSALKRISNLLKLDNSKYQPYDWYNDYDYYYEYPLYRSRSASPPPTTSFHHHKKKSKDNSLFLPSKRSPRANNSNNNLGENSNLENNNTSILNSELLRLTPRSNSNDNDNNDNLGSNNNDQLINDITDGLHTPDHLTSSFDISIPIEHGGGSLNEEELPSLNITPRGTNNSKPNPSLTMNVISDYHFGVASSLKPEISVDLMMAKCQTPLVLKRPKREDMFSSSLISHIKYHTQRRRRKYLMMMMDNNYNKDNHFMEDEFNSLREDFMENASNSLDDTTDIGSKQGTILNGNIMRRDKQLEDLSFFDLIHTERFDYIDPQNEDENNSNNQIFLGKRSEERRKQFLFRKLLHSREKLNVDLNTYLKELEENISQVNIKLHVNPYIIKIIDITNRIIESDFEQLLKQVYMKELNDLLMEIKDETEMEHYSLIMKELKKLIFIYSRVNRIISVYNRLPDNVKLSKKHHNTLHRVNTPPIHEISKLKHLKEYDAKMKKRGGSSSDLMKESIALDKTKQDTKINKLLQKWAEEGSTFDSPSTPSSESTITVSSVSTTSTGSSRIFSPKEQLLCRICEKFIPADTFTEHTNICAQQHEQNIKRITCEDKLKQLMHHIRKRKKDNQIFSDIYVLLKESYKAKTKQVLQESIEKLTKFSEEQKERDAERSLTTPSVIYQISTRAIELSQTKLDTLNEYVENFKKVSIMDFSLIKPISKGAYGKVYLARKISTPDIYAIKVIEKQYIYNHKNIAYLKNKEKIMTERNVLQQLMKTNHESKFIVNFFYSFTGKKYFYIVMEYCSGGSLDCLLEENIRVNSSGFDIDLVRKIIAETVLALEELHSMKIVHRDLKPDNMLIDKNGRLKLTDFGLSEVGVMDREEKVTTTNTTVVKQKNLNAFTPTSPPNFVVSPVHANSGSLSVNSISTLNVGSNSSGGNSGNEDEPTKNSNDDEMITIPGTPDYVAPELLLGEEHNEAVDWWALGCIAYELLLGVPPFNADSVEEIFDNILSGQYEWPEELPDEIKESGVEDFIRRLLDLNPKTRLGGKDVKNHPFLKPIDWEHLLDEELFTPVNSLEDTSRFSPRKQQYPMTPTHMNGVLSPFDTSSFNSDSSMDSPSPLKSSKGGGFGSMLSPTRYTLPSTPFGSNALSSSIDFSFSSSTAALKELNVKEYNEYLQKNKGTSPLFTRKTSFSEF
ncbi:hypothetical protein ABK040_006293 [Willaertia magna]